MEKKIKTPQQNRSMFLYTALIFAFALILIIIAFFGQTNISNLRNITEQATETVLPSITPETRQQETLAQMANRISDFEAENKNLNVKISIYEHLLRANSYIASENFEEAEAEIADIISESLTDDQQILYEQITEKINKRKEQ